MLSRYAHWIQIAVFINLLIEIISFLSQDSAIADDLVKILRQANQNVPDFLAAGGGGGGGDFGERNNFGGRDVRNSSAPAAHGGGGDDEAW